MGKIAYTPTFSNIHKKLFRKDTQKTSIVVVTAGEWAWGLGALYFNPFFFLKTVST